MEVGEGDLQKGVLHGCAVTGGVLRTDLLGAKSHTLISARDTLKEFLLVVVNEVLPCETVNLAELDELFIFVDNNTISLVETFDNLSTKVGFDKLVCFDMLWQRLAYG